MIQELTITQYRKIKNLKLKFSKGLNALSGTNGTCKSSLLHIISNSFQRVTTKCNWVNDKSCISVISRINNEINPKVEKLTRGDKKYNNPAPGVEGNLYTVQYTNGIKLNFRKHNSPRNSRYAIKPYYKSGAGDKLPFCPVIYLGLTRLVPYGEFNNDGEISSVKKILPEKYQRELGTIYKNFTNYDIQLIGTQQMGDIKVRTEFASKEEGIDSNTISAGEDNLFIILTALLSLKYYFESIKSCNDIESILLIDELDASLHPAYQIKLLDLLRSFSEDYKIQIFFTTHSMSALENLFKHHDNVLYFLDNITNIVLMEAPDIYKVKMHLSSLTSNDIYMDKVIPVFTEDTEARFFLNNIFNYFNEIHPEFRNVERFFYPVETNLGAENLRSIFSNNKLLRMTIKSICILDGDQKKELSNCIIVLPGRNGSRGEGLSPEKLLFEYATELLNKDDKFWINDIIISKGYSKLYYLEKIKNPLEEFENKINKQKQLQKEIDNLEGNEKEEKKKELDNIKVNKKPREFYKELFNKEKSFFELLVKHWLHNPLHKESIESFYSDLKKMFLKVAPYNEINKFEWKS